MLRGQRPQPHRPLRRGPVGRSPQRLGATTEGAGDGSGLLSELREALAPEEEARRRIQEHQPRRRLPVPVGEDQGVEPTEGVAHQDVGRGEAGGAEERAELVGHPAGVPGQGAAVAEPVARPVVDADPNPVPELVLQVAPVACVPAERHVHDDRGPSLSRAAQPEPVVVHGVSVLQGRREGGAGGQAGPEGQRRRDARGSPAGPGERTGVAGRGPGHAAGALPWAGWRRHVGSSGSRAGGPPASSAAARASRLSIPPKTRVWKGQRTYQ